MRIAVIDYDAGNLRSMARAIAGAGAEPVLVTAPVERETFNALVLPGVGAFGPAMRRLAAAGMVGWIRMHVGSGTPLVGVCLGMQMLYEGSEEGGGAAGLALLPGYVRRLPEGVKVPHMGWNHLRARRPAPLLEGVADGTHVYFVHSYVVQPADPTGIVAVTSYGIEFPAIVQHAGLIGMQFHPEKSGAAGARLLRNVLAFAAARSDAPAGAAPAGSSTVSV